MMKKIGLGAALNKVGVLISRGSQCRRYPLIIVFVLLQISLISIYLEYNSELSILYHTVFYSTETICRAIQAVYLIPFHLKR
ncbi:MAG: hypothetical protein Q4D32_05675 [Eubacteriales bacterium]|nr:hypothetical protein [Eubacteriales bacterium]